MSFELLAEKIAQKQNPTVMGLDPLIDYVPEGLRRGRSVGEALYAFNCGLIDCAADLIPAVKPQSAFYEMYGLEGLEALEKTIAYARKAGLYVILDAKRGDIGSTADAYARAYLGRSGEGPDCVTVNPYLGSDGILPFIRQAKANDKSMFILVKTSNPSSGEFQDVAFEGKTLYCRVGEQVENWGRDSVGNSGYSRCGAVVGATYPHQLAELRASMPHTFFLIPGYGAQGGTAADVAAAFDAHGGGAIVNSSRGLMCAYRTHGDPEQYQKYTREAVLNMKNDLTAVWNCGKM